MHGPLERRFQLTFLDDALSLGLEQRRCSKTHRLEGEYLFQWAEVLERAGRNRVLLGPNAPLPLEQRLKRVQSVRVGSAGEHEGAVTGLGLRVLARLQARAPVLKRWVLGYFVVGGPAVHHGLYCKG